MDPIMLNRIALIRQQEILDSAAKNRDGKSLRLILSQLGVLFIAAGQKMTNAAMTSREEQTIPSSINVENC